MNLMVPVRVPTLVKPSPWHKFTHLSNKYVLIVPFYLKLVQIISHADHFHWYMSLICKGLPSMANIFTCTSFFFVSLSYFHCTHFRGLVGAYMNAGSFPVSLVCPITHSFLNRFQPNLVQHFPHVCSICHTVFSLKKALECVCESFLHCRLTFAINKPKAK